MPQVPDQPYEDFDVGGIVRHMLEERGLRNGLDGYMPLTTELDAWHFRGGDSEQSRANFIYGRDDYDRVLAEMTGEINVLRRGLERALVAKERRDWNFAQEEGRLDPRRFGALVAGRANVFKTRQDRVELDTAVTLLVDLSGSMDGLRAFEAQRCIMALAEALERTSVKYEVLGFNNIYVHEHIRQRASDEPWTLRNYSRLGSLDMWLFKRFEERLFEAKPSIAAMTACATGFNTDGEAILLAHERLRKRPERKQVMVVLSDGKPRGFTRHAQGDDVFRAHLCDAVDYVEKRGVAIVAMGIQSDAPKHFYKRFVLVDDVEHLAREGIGLVASVLLDDRAAKRSVA